MKMKRNEFYKNPMCRYSGSALILAVVLTSLLAVIGTMFLMIARVDKASTSSIAENKELDFAVESIVAKISQILTTDVPGVANAEYYDYPGQKDKWLACLEPYDDSGVYKWRHISDIYGKLGTQGKVDHLEAEIVDDYQVRDEIDDSNSSEFYLADADGDGVSDSVWVKLEDVKTSKGKDVYAAIRIIDNSAMINVNTAYKFDPDGSIDEIDGSSQMNINLLGLSERSTKNTLNQLKDERLGGELGASISDYKEDVVWRYNKPDGKYTPFDISDELKLRNRYLLNYNRMTSRIEELWENTYDGDPKMPRSLIRNNSISSPNDWFWYTNNSSPDIDKYDYRHISTTHNMDRIINPQGEKMVNVNTSGADSLYKALRQDINVPNVNDVAAQIAVNLRDYCDNDSNVAVLTLGVDKYYGFEQPCIYISELVHHFVTIDALTDAKSYAIELYKPYFEDMDPKNDWQLVIGGNPIPVNWGLGSRRFHVIRFEDPNALAPLINPVFNDIDPNDPNIPSDYNDLPQNAPVYGSHFRAGDLIELQRRVDDVNNVYITVDSKIVPDPNADWLTSFGSLYSMQRDIGLHKCVRRLWGRGLSSTLGGQNDFVSSDSIYIQAHPKNRWFTNIGEIGMVFRKNAYGIGPADTEATTRLNLSDPDYQNIFQYLTVFDSANDKIDNDGDGPKDTLDTSGPEWKIAGRININTAPWFVIAQLPWVSQRKGGYDEYNLAKAIVAYRDMLGDPCDPVNYSDRSSAISSELDPGINSSDIREGPGFASIGELNFVIDGDDDYSMRYYKLKTGDLGGYPDLSGGDGAADDFEERDIIFARISNLVTVRSDIFTAYILVRIGVDGPQKRMIAILDRSDVYSSGDKVKIVALHPVPDPR